MPERGLLVARPAPPLAGRSRAHRARAAEVVLDGVRDLPALGPPGRPLDPPLRRDLSRCLGRDLTRIRLHHDWFASELTDALDAQAVAHGDELYFAADAADVTTSAGRSLLVHELVHSDQGGAVVGRGTHHHEEAEAERRAIAAGREAPADRDRPDGGDGEDTYALDDGGEARAAASDRWSRLARRARTTLTRRDAARDPVETPDVMTAGEALVRLVDRLVSRDPDDRGGRLRAVLGGLEASLRDAVVTTVADRRGGSVRVDLAAIAEERAPADGGRSDAEPLPPADGGRPDAEALPPAGATGAEDGEPSAPSAAETAPRADEEAAAAEAEGAEQTPPAGAHAPGATGPDEAGAAGAPAPAPEAEAEAAPADEQPPAPGALAAPAAELPDAGAAAGAEAPAAEGPQASAAARPDVPSGGEATAEAAEPSAAEAGTALAEDAGPHADTAPEGEPAGVDEAPAAPGPDAAASAQDARAGAGGPLGAEGETEAVAPELPPGAEAGAGPPQVAPAEPAPPAPPADAMAAPGSGAAEEPSAADASAVPAAEEPSEITQPPAPEEDAEPSLPAASPATEAPGAEPAEAEEPAGPGEPVVGGAAGEAGALEAVPEEDAGQPATADAEPGETPAAGEPTGGEPAVDGAEPPPVRDAAEPVLADPRAPSGGGGGGAAIADRPEPAAPDVSGMEPQAALTAVAKLPATALSGRLSAVSASAQKTVSDGRADLAANPPSMERPSGVPADKDASLPPAPLPPLPAAVDRTVGALPAAPGAPPPVPAEPPPAPAPVTANVPEAKAGGDTQISAEDAARIQGAVKELPETDPALHVDAGPVPALELTGGEDPQRVRDHATEVADTTASTRKDGLADARADMGENEVLPQVPKETLTADVTGGGSGEAAAPPAAATGQGAAPGAAATGAVTPAGAGGGEVEVAAAAVDAVAAEQGGDRIAGSTEAGGTALGAAREDHDSSVQEARTEADRQINEEIAANGAEQTDARRDVRSDVGAARKDWVGEQDALAGRSATAADAAQREADTSVDKARTTARTDAGKAVQDGNADITRERDKAETEARAQREKAEKETDDGGFFSWLASKVKSFVDGIKKAIHAAFELARKAVDLAISAAQKLAVAAIELGRKAVVAAIEIGGKALAAAGDIVLAGFPEARARFHKAITDRVEAAKKTVNELADQLKAGVKKLLDGLGALLKGALTLLEKAYTAAIDAVAKVVDTVIKAAKAWVDALLDFAALVADIASDPVQWLRNLGAGLLDGVRNHVWPSLVTAVKDWFKTKVEEVVGVGKLILDVLRKGGITFAKIVTMAWTAIKESLPGILIQLLIEKLVAMLIPAGGALALIVDGIRAAWGAASKILAAFQKFIAFLKAVKGGNAGPKFGELVGAAAVAVMDFLANFVLNKLKGAGQKVGGTLRKMAERFMKVVKKVAGAVKRGATAAVGAIRRGVAAAGRAIRRGAVALTQTVRKALPKGLAKLGARAARFVGTQVRKGVAKAKATYQRAKERLFGKRKKRPRETAREKLARVIGVIRPRIGGWFDRGIGRIALFGGLKLLQVRHALRGLKASYGSDGTVTVLARVNPEAPAALGWSPGSELRRLVGEIAEELLRDPAVLDAAEAMRGKGSKDDPIRIRSGADYLAAVHASAANVARGETTHYAIGAAGAAATTRSSKALSAQNLALFAQQAETAGAISPGQAGSILSLLPHRKVGRGYKYDKDFVPNLQRVSARSAAQDPSGTSALVNFMQTGATENLRKPEREKLAGMALLTFTTEATRDPSHLADVAFATSLVGQKRGRLSAVIGGDPDAVITTKDLFKAEQPGQGGILPMTAAGAAKSSLLLQGADVESNLDRLGGAAPPGSNQPRPVREPREDTGEPRPAGKPMTAAQVRANNLAHTRMLLAERWVEIQMQADPEAFRDRASAKAAIERHLRQFYRLALEAPSPSVPGAER